MAQLNWGGEGGTNGAAITPANSGGASGDAWDTVGGNVSGRIAQYETSVPLVGNVSAVFATGGTAGTAFVQWTTAILNLWPAGMTTQYFRTYLNYASLPPMQRIILQWLDTTAAINRSNILLLATGQLRLRNAVNGTVATFTTTMAANTTYRLEGQVDGVAAGGAYSMSLFLGNSTTPLESVSGTAAFGGTIGSASFGWLTGGTSSPNQYMDAMQINDTGLPGPAPAGATQGRWAGVRAGQG